METLTQQPPPPTDADRVNILLVDDLPEKILVLETVLGDLGQNMITARTGEEALRKVLEYDFAVILLDINMPGMDGLETAAFIRKRKKSAHTPIIFITAFADEVHTTQGYSLGAVDYIMSPFSPDVLRTKVKVFVDLFRMTQQVRRQADERVALAREQAARAAAEDATRRSTFLAEASTVLSSSLDLQATARDLLRVVVPYLADLAGVTVVGEAGRPWQSELAWVYPPDPTLHTRQLTGTEAPSDELRATIDRVLGTGKVARLDGIAIPYPHNGSPGPVVQITTAVILPLLARGRTLGALTLAMSTSGRRYTPADLALAEDLAGRAAIALDNARLYQNIQDQDRRKNEFLAMLAHELRNPLAPVRNAVQVLRMVGTHEPMLVRSRDMIDRQVTHMARLIDDLLDMSRLSRGKILLRKEVVDLRQLVHDVVDDYRSILDDNGLTLKAELPTGGLHILGDPTRLAQVLGNVLHNASKFTDRGGRVAVLLRPEDDPLTAVIAVKDTGIGMEPDMLDRVFDTFSQADSSLDRSRGGLGLGLALVKGLVDLHGGEVHAHSAGLGHGTEIVIRLPLHTAPAPSAGPPPDAVNGAGSYRVLVIDDNEDSAESMRMLFDLGGHEVAVAYDGPAGVAAARSFRPQVIVCDIGLPGGMDGYAVARALREDPDFRAVQLIALTGYGQEEDLRRSREAGFHAHLTKPVDFVELERLLGGLSGAGAD